MDFYFKLKIYVLHFPWLTKKWKFVENWKFEGKKIIWKWRELCKVRIFISNWKFTCCISLDWQRDENLLKIEDLWKRREFQIDKLINLNDFFGINIAFDSCRCQVIYATIEFQNRFCQTLIEIFLLLFKISQFPVKV